MAYSHKHRRRRKYKKRRAKKKIHPQPLSAKQHYVLDQATRITLTPATIANNPQQILTSIPTGHNTTGTTQAYVGFPNNADFGVIFSLSGLGPNSLLKDYMLYIKRIMSQIQVTNQTNIPCKIQIWRHRIKQDAQALSTAFSPDKVLETALTQEGMAVPGAGGRINIRGLTFKDSCTFKEYFSAKLCKTKMLQAGHVMTCKYVNKKAPGIMHTSYYSNTTAISNVAYLSRRYTTFWTVIVNPVLAGDATTGNLMEAPLATVFVETHDVVDWYQTAGNQLTETNYQFAGFGTPTNGASAVWINPFQGVQQPVIKVN